LTSSDSSQSQRYSLRFMPEALAEWNTLDGSVRAPLKKLLAKRLDQPHVPGGELRCPLSGCYKIKLLKQGVRLVYAVEDQQLVVLVLAVDKRENGMVYGSAAARRPPTATRIAPRSGQRKPPT
jgi:mRNA interferase RelE/StbE